MADEPDEEVMQEEEAQENTYENFQLPPPPHYFKSFTEKNLQRLKELKEAQDGQGDTTNAPTWLDLPPELRCLVPPEPPEDGVVTNFGESKTVRLYHLQLLSIHVANSFNQVPRLSQDSARDGHPTVIS